MSLSPGLLALFWAVLGTAVGSFLNVVADRLPQRRSIMAPPSQCGACRRRLGPAELVPVLSYLMLRGRCRTCGAAIGPRSLVVELDTGLLFALVAWQIAPTRPDQWLALLLHSFYLSVLVIVAVIDLEHGLILNRVIFPAIAIGLVGALLAGWPGLWLYWGAGLVGAGVIAAIIALVPGGMGWGDVRLAGFVGLITGLPGLPFALFLGFVAGGIVAGALLASGRYRRGDTLPLGPFLAVGGAAVLLYHDEMLRIFYSLAAAL